MADPATFLAGTLFSSENSLFTEHIFLSSKCLLVDTLNISILCFNLFSKTARRPFKMGSLRLTSLHGKLCVWQMARHGCPFVATKHIWQEFFLFYSMPVFCRAQTLTHTHTHHNNPGVTQTWHLEGDALGWAWFQPDYRLRRVRETNVCVRLCISPKITSSSRKATNVHLKAKEICFSKAFSRMCVCLCVRTHACQQIAQCDKHVTQVYLCDSLPSHTIVPFSFNVEADNIMTFNDMNPFTLNRIVRHGSCWIKKKHVFSPSVDKRTHQHSSLFHWPSSEYFTYLMGGHFWQIILFNRMKTTQRARPGRLPGPRFLQNKDNKIKSLFIPLSIQLSYTHTLSVQFQDRYMLHQPLTPAARGHSYRRFIFVALYKLIKIHNDSFHPEWLIAGSNQSSASKWDPSGWSRPLFDRSKISHPCSHTATTSKCLTAV